MTSTLARAALLCVTIAGGVRAQDAAVAEQLLARHRQVVARQAKSEVFVAELREGLEEARAAAKSGDAAAFAPFAQRVAALDLGILIERRDERRRESELHRRLRASDPPVVRAVRDELLRALDRLGLVDASLIAVREEWAAWSRATLDQDAVEPAVAGEDDDARDGAWALLLLPLAVALFGAFRSWPGWPASPLPVSAERFRLAITIPYGTSARRVRLLVHDFVCHQPDCQAPALAFLAFGHVALEYELQVTMTETAVVGLTRKLREVLQPTSAVVGAAQRVIGLGAARSTP